MFHNVFNPNIDLTGKVAIVTGGASGIGYAVSKLFSESGAIVCILDKNEEQLNKVIDKIHSSHAYVADVCNTKSIDKAVECIVLEQKKIDILVNSAGIGPVEKAELFSEEDWHLTVSVNLSGTFFMAQRVGRQMIKQQTGGRIVNLASQAGIVAIDKHVAYGASKAGVLSITKSLAYEWGEYGIRVNSVSPTVTETPLSSHYWNGEVRSKAIENLPLRRFAQPSEIAASVLFLASDMSSMITGENLVVDGGFTIH